MRSEKYPAAGAASEQIEVDGSNNLYSIHGIQEIAIERVTFVQRLISPPVALVIFTAINFALYFDRGALAASLAYIHTDGMRDEKVLLSDLQAGFVVSGFMIGFMVASPIAASFGGMMSTKLIIFVGMSIWAAGCLMTAFSSNYGMLVVSRTFVGMGEAAFVGFAVTIVDNIAPATHRTMWIGVFYSMIPLGTAAGMAVGGTLAALKPILEQETWRLTFLAEVAASAPLLLLCLLLPSRYTIRRPNESRAEYLSIHRASWLLLTNLTYILIVFGLAMYCFVVGAVAVFAIPFLSEGPLALSHTNASIIIGVITGITGLVGAVIGGTTVDLLGGSGGTEGAIKSQLFNIAMVALCIPTGIVALFAEQLWVFCVFFIISVTSLFAVTAPVNASILTVVPSIIRPYAVGFSVLCIHLLGDFPSPIIAGALSDHFSSGCRNLDAASCEATTTMPRCRWIEQSNLGSSSNPQKMGKCVNEYQLRNALLIVFSVLTLAIPSWMFAFLRLRHRLRVEEVLSQDSLLRRSVPYYTETDDGSR